MATEFGSTALTNSPDAYAAQLCLAEGPLKFAWQHCTETAAFLGGFFAAYGAQSGLDPVDAKHSIGYLTNELLENVFKFRAPGDVFIEASLEQENFEFKLTSFVTEHVGLQFQQVLEEITEGDPADLLIARIEANAIAGDDNGSGLGLLTLMGDYHARMGWSFSHGSSAAIQLETYAVLRLARHQTE